ncbi:organoarsenical effux MFS transporter ArsJ [Thalassotalea ponticola]|uniref:organoarsenical effux MFS transporter ArsJ n=1 Tax=Thalassotalea ponticola TaxID=1523392 RepID=UPI0025B44681|nr:organoarsenical effux MFS transporter ArsJ [Thalassotalea ponticola]MDN3652453.1 organoarsenical effux MFS transporter ArsJ [Thalassotalea ponticola]
MLANMSQQVKQYLIITGNYWAFTLTDGALRMLVVLYFHQLGYTPLAIAMLFLFYELFGVVTNLIGGWLGARLGLNKTMNIGLVLQIIALLMLTLPNSWLTVPYVMIAQALSGIAKDLNKMSAKSAIKLCLPDDAQGTLYQWVARLTGSKNALKGIGFFLGGALLSWLGFQGAMWLMASVLGLVWLFSLYALAADLGKQKNKPKFRQLLSKSGAINWLSAARLFLFGARDVWFVVALPVALATTYQWPQQWIGGFMALWIIFYGVIQSQAPRITGRQQGQLPNGQTALTWVAALSITPLLIGLMLADDQLGERVLVVGLFIFGALFAVNSSLHSYLIVSYANRDGVSMDVGFYYMANAMGRLLGTVLSGYVYQQYGLQQCLYVSAILLLIATALSFKLPKTISGQN